MKLPFLKGKSDQAKIKFLILTVAMALGFMLAVKYCFETIGALKERQSVYNGEQEKLSRLTASLQDLRSIDPGSLNRQIKILEIALPGQKDIPQVLAVIGSAVINSGLILSEIDIRPGSGGGETSDGYRIEFSLSGKKESFAEFATAMNKWLPLSSLQVLEIKETDSNQSQASGSADKPASAGFSYRFYLKNSSGSALKRPPVKSPSLGIDDLERYDYYDFSVDDIRKMTKTGRKNIFE